MLAPVRTLVALLTPLALLTACSGGDETTYVRAADDVQVMDPDEVAGARPDLGIGARLLGAAEFRRTPTWAVALRAEVGADAWSAGVVPTAAVTLGLQSQFARRRP